MSYSPAYRQATLQLLHHGPEIVQWHHRQKSQVSPISSPLPLLLFRPSNGVDAKTAHKALSQFLDLAVVATDTQSNLTKRISPHWEANVARFAFCEQHILFQLCCSHGCHFCFCGLTVWHNHNEEEGTELTQRTLWFASLVVMFILLHQSYFSCLSLGG